MRLASYEVKRLLGHGQRASAGSGTITFSARALWREATDDKPAAAICAGIALAVPKKQLPRAVDRNRVKRVLRETFRHHAARSQPIEMLLTLSAIPKSIAKKTRSKATSIQIRAAADAILTKVAARFPQSGRAGSR
jgi:ribonuclease P protein component